jgi:putative transposase
VDAEVRELIRRMAVDNNWGAPRIHGELRMLGFDVSERTVFRYLRELHRRPEARQSWRTFLHNHTVCACDFLQVFELWFRPLFAFFVIDVNSKQVRREPSDDESSQDTHGILIFGGFPDRQRGECSPCTSRLPVLSRGFAWLP